MNPKDSNSESGRAEASSAIAIATASALNKTVESDSMKRAAAKKLIERYYYQLTDGCSNPSCDNEHCASSGKVKNLSRNQAAARALKLFATKARLCESQPAKIPKTQSSEGSLPADITATTEENSSLSTTPGDSPLTEGTIASSSNPPFSKLSDTAVPVLTEEKLIDVIDSCKKDNSFSLLIRTLGQIYSNTKSLSKSFMKEASSSLLEAALEKASIDLKDWKKEDIRALEGDLDKDEDSKEVEESKVKEPQQTVPPDDVTLDLDSLHRAYHALFQIPGHVFESALIHALLSLSETAELELKFHNAYEQDPDYLNLFIIVMEIPSLGSPECLDMVLPPFCKAIACLPICAQARLARVWAKYCHDRLKTMVETLQQLITVKVISGQLWREYCVNDDETVTAPTKVLKILYYANILAGQVDSTELQKDAPDIQEGDDLRGILLGAVGRESKEPKVTYEDPLAKELGVNELDSRKPLIPFSDFYNEPLSDTIEMDKDFAYYKTGNDRQKFSFMNCSFILTTATKSLGLYYDNRIRMFSERRLSILQNEVHGYATTSPYLKLKIRRSHIVEDALVVLEMVTMENPMDLKKQLVVEFEGEHGIDEGGVSKEFFQLIVEEIFKPDYGMFTFCQETQMFWFNPTCFESDAQFTLIGIVLGLAIYNNIILDIHFPMVVYRKLMGKRGTLDDLIDFNPSLYHGLKELLLYQEDDIEDVFIQTFKISYKDVFGVTLTQELKENGENILVNHSNKQEYVDLYADFLLNKLVEKQFRAFRRGFQMVTDESPLKMLFRPEEVEQLVCGSKNFDFNELQEATEYDGGYTASSKVICNFWEIVHEMPVYNKQKLLQFTTGSDRVPVGGLSKLKLIIARNGPDSERLPTAHTCFNVLLLPEYVSKEKLQDRLMKAITYSKGFGML